MLVPFQKYFGLGSGIVSVIRQLHTQRKFISDEIAPILKDARRHNDGTLDETDFKKITHYYGWAVPAILGAAFCELRGTEMSVEERWASTCQGAMTGLFDDFFDKDYMADEFVRAKIDPDAHQTAQQSNERLFNIFYGKVLSNVPDVDRVKKALLAVHHAQVASKQQVDPALPHENLWPITEEKGGTSLLFYRAAFAPTASDQEIALLYHLGASMQLGNDIFDVYKDREKNIRTLVTEAKKVDDLRRLLLERLNYAYKAAYLLPHPRQRIRRFLNNLSIGVFSRCFVCLDHLEQNEKITNGVFQVKSYSRSQLICDMDTKKNMLRSAAYHIKTIK
jgi:hypothetical protein